MRLDKRHRGCLKLHRHGLHSLLLVVERNDHRNVLDVGLLLARNILCAEDDLRLVE